MKTKGKILLTIVVGIIAVSIVGFYGYSLGSSNSLPHQLLGTSAFSNITNKLPKLFVVQSGSMEPAIPTASLIITTAKNTYWAGDVVTFYRNGNKKRPITHRIIAKLYPDGINAEPAYLTSGDANDDIDSWQIKNTDIVGKTTYTIPYLGYLVDFAKKPYGFILFVIVPATIIIYEELRTVFVEFKKFLRKLFKRDVSRVLTKDGSRLPKAAVAIPFFGALIVIGGVTLSIYFDNEESIDNIFSAAQDFGLTPSPTAIPNNSTLTISPVPTNSQIDGVLVINEVLADPTCTVGQGQNEKSAQWIEVYNGYSTTINLQDFEITDGTNTVALVNAGNIDVAPGGFALLSHDNSIWIHCYDDNDVITANLGTGNLNLNTGSLQLLDPSDVIIDTVRWGPGQGLEPVQDESIERQPDGFDTETGSNFEPTDFVIRTTPQPGL